MTVFICVDDRGGMLFNGRRQSRDRLLISDLSKTVGDGLLYITDMSEPLFESSEISAVSVPSPLESAAHGDYVFNECFTLGEHLEKTERIILYKWNKKYPYDLSLDIEPTAVGYRLTESYDFVGTSHERITKEVYER